MARDGRGRSGRALRRAKLVLVLSLVLGPAACGGSVDAPPDEPEATETPSSDHGLRGDTLLVYLDDFAILVPDTIPAGELLLVARNRGVEDHNFEVMRAGELVWKFHDEIGPQRTGEAVLTLEEGEYSVLCTISSHDSRGMFTRITVVDASET